MQNNWTNVWENCTVDWLYSEIISKAWNLLKLSNNYSKLIKVIKKKLFFKYIFINLISELKVFILIIYRNLY